MYPTMFDSGPSPPRFWFESAVRYIRIRIRNQSISASIRIREKYMVKDKVWAKSNYVRSVYTPSDDVGAGLGLKGHDELGLFLLFGNSLDFGYTHVIESPVGALLGLKSTMLVRWLILCLDQGLALEPPVVVLHRFLGLGQLCRK
jgi:hypothetical protein